jgi:hypothetical protein
VLEQGPPLEDDGEEYEGEEEEPPSEDIDDGDEEEEEEAGKFSEVPSHALFCRLCFIGYSNYLKSMSCSPYYCCIKKLLSDRGSLWHAGMPTILFSFSLKLL